LTLPMHSLVLPIHRRPISTLFPYTTLFRSANYKAEHKQIFDNLKAQAETYNRLHQLMDETLAGRLPTPWCGYLTLDEDAKEVLGDRKSTRLNSSHVKISYAVFCLKKKKQKY